MPNIDWSQIRTINGSQNLGFEEFCAQLARRYTPADAQFVRTGNPDSGVECYCIFSDGTKWGWQAKYFMQSPTTSQWRQMLKSFTAALKAHPSLRRYIFCLPIDLPDHRRQGTTSAREKWIQHVCQWEKQGHKHNINVTIELWDASTITNFLTKPNHAGLFQFFFNKTICTTDWFETIIREATNTAGPRYTPEIHVPTDTVASLDLDTFARTPESLKRIKSHGASLNNARLRLETRSLLNLNQTHKSSFSKLDDALDTVEHLLTAIKHDPIEPYPFTDIEHHVENTLSIITDIAKELYSLNYKTDSTRNEDATSVYRRVEVQLNTIEHVLLETAHSITRTKQFANSNFMILTGEAGIGKTHLLCQFAEHQVASDHPVVLLMGQKFTSSSDPMGQILEHLDFRNVTFDEFIGAFESAAEVVGQRALLIIDAINEGQGQSLWRPHLHTLVDRVCKSRWIGLVLSVREGFLDHIVPESIVEQAAVTTHTGFYGIEFDAVKVYFSYYGLELPSTPLLQPEFSNPLWLKIICTGLHGFGYSRIPRGFSGITQPLDLFTKTINRRLAHSTSLDYDEADDLVQQAIDRIVKRMVTDRTSWLSYSDAKRLVNEVLPGRQFSNSLYRHLVLEGLLLEVPNVDGSGKCVVFSYERISDHLKVKYLLDEVEPESLDAAFSAGGSLDFVFSEHLVPAGLVEALYIQVPERYDVELTDVIPSPDLLFDPEAFCQSIVWRNPDAVTDETKRLVSQLAQDIGFGNPALEALLTVAVIPDHPLNARFLDDLLRPATIAERDAWWTVQVHFAKHESGPIGRLVAWPLSETEISCSEEVVFLAATALAWLCAVSDRFVRDRATKALVGLLDRHLVATRRVLEHFAEVNDPYVKERIYAAVYGVSLRNHDVQEIGYLAMLVYDRMFAHGSPTPHILTRDYARGIIDRAIYLGAELDINLQEIRPPYDSNWPVIPSSEECEVLLDQMRNLDEALPEMARAWWSVEFSLRSGDFARYIIGTNSSEKSNNWLTRRLEDEPWQTPEQRRDHLLAQLNTDEREALETYEKARLAAPPSIEITFVEPDGRSSSKSGKSLRLNPTPSTQEKTAQEDLAQAEQALRVTLSVEHLSQWESLKQEAPRLDLGLIQRYILKRVVDLGWDAERFGNFDRLIDRLHNRGRDAHKPERIGKKYQWIALHEILAYLSDRHQYYEFGSGTQPYEGPWQLGVRDIDPSLVRTRDFSVARAPERYRPTWWAPLDYDNWQPLVSTECWIADQDDIPTLDGSLVVRCPSHQGSNWYNAYAIQVRKQPRYEEVGENGTESREVWLRTQAYLVPVGRADDFIDWVLSGAYWRNEWTQSIPELNGVFVGEHAWSSPSKRHYLEHVQYSLEWHFPNDANPSKAQDLVVVGSTGYREYDCSIEESDIMSLYLPSVPIVEGCNLRWEPDSANYIDERGAIGAFDPSLHESGPNALLIRADLLDHYIKIRNLELCWSVIGEKQTMGTHGQPYGWLKMFGGYVSRNGKPVGSHRCQFISSN